MLWYNGYMRKTRLIENCRCYHLMSRLYPPAARLLAQRGAMRGAHRAFFLDDDESMREAMSEILAAREAERAEREAKGEPALSRRTDPLPSKADPGLAMPRKHGVELERGRPEIVERILKLLESGPLRSSVIRKAVGICSGIHLSRYYLTPMMEKGLIKRTDPDHPQSPQQRYRLA